jgi:hypothetical protein
MKLWMARSDVTPVLLFVLFFVVLFAAWTELAGDAPPTQRIELRAEYLRRSQVLASAALRPNMAWQL